MSRWVFAAGVNGAMGVAAGAWAAHGAAMILEPTQIEWVRTGSSYQLWHAAALLGVAALARPAPARCLTAAGLGFTFGALAFSCSLYLMAVAGWYWVAWLTPVGGALMLAGWAALMVHGLLTWRGRRS